MAHGIFLSVVIPAYNEARRLPTTIGKIYRYLLRKGFAAEIIVVDDGSIDSTVKIVESLQDSIPSLLLLQNGENRGKGFSVRRGSLSAQGDYILFTDADLSTPIEELDNFLKLKDAYDVIFASRALPASRVTLHQPWFREHLGRFFNIWVRILLLPEYMDTQCGFKLFRTEAIRPVFQAQRISDFAFDIEILLLARRYKLTMKEQPVEWLNSQETKVTFRSMVRMFFSFLRIVWIYKLRRVF